MKVRQGRVFLGWHHLLTWGVIVLSPAGHTRQVGELLLREGQARFSSNREEKTLLPPRRQPALAMYRRMRFLAAGGVGADVVRGFE